MYTFKMDSTFYILQKYVYKIIIKQSKQIVQTKIKSQKLKKKKKINTASRQECNRHIDRQISSCGSNQGFGSELFPILLPRKMQFAKYLM